jgi:HEAT repeat protein
MMKLAALAGVFLLVGCATKDSGPLQSHGKPVGHWVAELKNPDPRARKKAVTALGHVGTADAAAMPALIGAVKDRDAEVRDQAVLALLNLGTDAKEAVPALTEACKDSNATVRAHAAKALERISGPP